MSGTLNKVMLIGHLGDEVKIHYFEANRCIGRFPLATNETYISKQTNERITNTEWHNVVVRNKAAEICEKYLSKGDKVYIEGRLKTRKWQDDKGSDKYSTEIHCNDFTFLSTRKENQNYATNKPVASNPMINQQTTNKDSAARENDNLPF